MACQRPSQGCWQYLEECQPGPLRLQSRQSGVGFLKDRVAGNAPSDSSRDRFKWPTVGKERQGARRVSPTSQKTCRIEARAGPAAR
ncbi:hypothetical protein L1887_48059 [Cichorium endivia]|nr:hypothetical protein L1887_48059 [Cichorium endivia]